MSETIVNALVHLFAIFESVKEDAQKDSGLLIVKPYLEKNLNQELAEEYLGLFYDYLAFYKETNHNPDKTAEIIIDPTSIIQIAKICNQINKELGQAERIVVFIELLELIRADEKVTDKEEEFASLVAMNFNMRTKEVVEIKAFIFENGDDTIDAHRGLVIDNKMTEWPEEIAWMIRKKKSVPNATKFHHLFVENLFGRIFVLHIPSVNSYVFRYDGPLNLYLEGNKILVRKSYFLKPGAIIKGPNIRSIYETEITKQFLQVKNRVKTVLNGEDLEFHFDNSENGIQKFSFSEESGHLVGIMGGSGAGKSTLLNILNGKIEPTNGRVHINGHTVQEAAREGVIGYVPQDDLLFEELTVYQNLYYNARICFSDFSKPLIKNTIDKVLDDLDLYDIRDLKVGDPMNKSISGGQRKRLNIALELMREPSILFVDEPTSGLSSMDSEKVMMLLKDLARKGKLVIAIIHQPSSAIFKLFDKLWLLDKGGFPIYNGNPIDAVVYFKTMSTQVNAAESECPRCGNVIPEQILQIVEAREIDDRGKESGTRKVSPADWYIKYKENIEKKLKRTRYDDQLPPSNFHIPNAVEQFAIFHSRNVRAKWSNLPYILINLLEPPLLALILGYFSKYTTPEGSYLFSENKNLPVFMFMAIVVSLFLGMSVSAEEIFKDRKILERETYLNLSRSSYLQSKIFFLFLLSAFQSFCFVFIGSLVLNIEGLMGYYWLILFSTSCFANLVGLNISASLNSIIAIYILIPFVLVPQLLLGGAMINFDDLHKNVANPRFVPVVGDLMVSRWAYEGLSIAQFRYNDYSRHFYDVEQQMSESSFMSGYLVPRLQNLARNLSTEPDKAIRAHQMALLKNELLLLSSRYRLPLFPQWEALQSDSFNDSFFARTNEYLETSKKVFQNRYQRANRQKDSIYYALTKQLGKEDFEKLRNEHFNENLDNLMTNRSALTKIYVGEDFLMQKKDPVYTMPYSTYGRAHFYAPYKRLGPYRIDTFWFNVMTIWLFTAFLYYLLANDYLRKVLNFYQDRQKRRRKNAYRTAL